MICVLCFRLFQPQWHIFKAQEKWPFFDAVVNAVPTDAQQADGADARHGGDFFATDRVTTSHSMDWLNWLIS